jgi:hypothetical protein
VLLGGLALAQLLPRWQEGVRGGNAWCVFYFFLFEWVGYLEEKCIISENLARNDFTFSYKV